MELSPGVLALIGTLFGGVALKVTESWLGRSRAKVDDAAQIRSELRAELTAKNAEIVALEAEVDKWKGLYYDIRDLKVQVETELRIVKAQLAEAMARVQKSIDSSDKKS